MPDNALQDARDALACFGIGPSAQVEFAELGRSTSLSDARLWRVLADGEPLVLKRWTQPHRESQYAAAHHALHLAAQGGAPTPRLRTTPAGDTLICRNQCWWELASFLPGCPPEPWRREHVLRSCGALAQLHAAWAVDRPQRVAASQLASVVRRRELCREALGAQWLPAAERLAAGAPVSPAFVAELANCVVPRLEEVRDQLADVPHEPTPVQVVHGDARRVHFLFDGEQLTGIVDFGAVTRDTPMLDLARLLVEVRDDDPDHWAAGRDAYHSVRPLGPVERRLLPLLAVSGVVLAGYRWLRWTLVDRRSVGEPKQVATRIEEIAGRIRALDAFR